MRIGRRRRAAGAIGVGAALGLGLLAWIAPGEAPAPEPRRERAEARAPRVKQRDLTVRRAAPPPAQVAVADEPEAQAPVEESDRGVLVVDVVDEEGRPAEGATVLAVDCPGFRHGPPGQYLVEAGPCTLRAVRRDGALWARGPELTVEVGRPDPAYAMLELRGERTGGIGIRFRPTPGGMEVVEVHPGTPAERAGLQPGDVVVAVGDALVDEMDAQRFVEAMTGPEGSEVEFTVGFDGDTGHAQQTVRLERAFLDG